MNLEDARKKIDDIDTNIIDLLSKRLSFVSVNERYKLKKNIERKDEKREEEILKNKTYLGAKKGLDDKYIIDLYKRIILESHIIEKKIMKR